MKSWKVQKFFGDVIYDMRSRGLLPLAGVLVVAMIAVPFYLSSQSTEAGPPPVVQTPDSSEIAPENQTAVVAYEPGVRDYKERLSEQSEKNPFVQQFQPKPAPSGDASGGGDAAAVSGGGGDAGGTTGTGTDTGGTDTSSGSAGLKYFYYEVDVSIGEAGQKPKQVNNLTSFDSLDPLPSREVPLVLFAGAIKDGKGAVFNVSRDVVGVQGNVGCAPPEADNCQMLAIPVGKTANLVYGYTNKVYKLTVRDVELVKTSKPPTPDAGE